MDGRERPAARRSGRAETAGKAMISHCLMETTESQLTSAVCLLTMKLEQWTSQLFERESSIGTKEVALAVQEALLAARETLLARTEAKLWAKTAERSQRQEQQLMLHEDYLTRCTISIEHQLEVLKAQLEQVDQDKESLQEAETRLHQRVRLAQVMLTHR